ncbi:hypothetical protein [Paenibacillus paeoniae]|uniref:hypothetical protein n=1 Tax=Paenibacillus paeoniae TaxID=2292705 RepID=UPI0010586BF3|nr:hypothetical protein [Paenibacillus paeoniae]
MEDSYAESRALWCKPARSEAGRWSGRHCFRAVESVRERRNARVKGIAVGRRPTKRQRGLCVSTLNGCAASGRMRSRNLGGTT